MAWPEARPFPHDELCSCHLGSDHLVFPYHAARRHEDRRPAPAGPERTARAYLKRLRERGVLELVRASGAARMHGVESRVIDGVKMHLTTPTKTVADCFRFRRHVGLEVAFAALKDYLEERKGSIDALVEAARADRIHAFMRPYLEALA